LKPLTELELTNALELRIFRKEATATEVRRARAEFEEHARGGVFELKAMPTTAYERARQISRKQTALRSLPTLDILHVASALLLRAEKFWTFDQRRSELATAEALGTT
jgi:predicted nucleic acid-binding protein